MRRAPQALTFIAVVALFWASPPSQAKETYLACRNPPIKTGPQCFQYGAAQLKGQGCWLSSAASPKTCYPINGMRTWYCQVPTLNCVTVAAKRRCPRGFKALALPKRGKPNYLNGGLCKAGR